MSPGPDAPREGGFVAFHRRMLSSPELLDFSAEQLWTFMVCISMANWRPGSFTVGGRTVDVGRGQLAHSIEAIARAARVSPKAARTAIEKLISRGQMTGTDLGTRSGRRVRVLTIVNYSKYQDPAESLGRRSGTEMGTDPIIGTSNTTTPTPDGVAPVLALVPPGEGKPKPVRKARKQAPELEAAKARLESVYVAKFPGSSLPWTGSCWGYLAKMLKATTEDGLAASWAAFLASKFYPEKSFFIFATRAYANVRFSAEAAAPKPQPRRVEEFF